MGLLNLRLDPIPQLGLQTNEITEQPDNIETHNRTVPDKDSTEFVTPCDCASTGCSPVTRCNPTQQPSRVATEPADDCPHRVQLVPLVVSTIERAGGRLRRPPRDPRGTASRKGRSRPRAAPGVWMQAARRKGGIVMAGHPWEQAQVTPASAIQVSAACL